MRYVAGFLMDTNDRVLLVRKLKPDWQRGKLNGIGGKIEAFDASPMDAMIREWKEETGEDRTDWRHFCNIVGNDFDVHFFASRCHFSLPLRWPVGSKNDAGEYLEFHYATYLHCLSVIPNLHWLIPMAFYDIYNPQATVTNER